MYVRSNEGFVRQSLVRVDILFSNFCLYGEKLIPMYSVSSGF